MFSLFLLSNSISASSQLSFVQPLLSVAILNGNIFTWVSLKFDYVANVRISSLSRGNVLVSVYLCSEYLFNILLSRIPPKISLA